MDIEETLLPEEAAKYLGMSTQKLARYRREGRLIGKQVGTSNLYVYRISDLRQADLSAHKRGPKPKKNSDVAQNSSENGR